MERAVVFANGRMEEIPPFTRCINPNDLIIAADGGMHHCLSLGIKPNVIIGDFDSLETDEIIAFSKAGVETIQYPCQKDETDLELDMQLVLKRGDNEVYILGALGARWDMTLGNILLMAHPSFSELKIHMLDGAQELILLRSGEDFEIHGHAGDPLSLLPLGGDAQGITTRGLKYPLNNESLAFGSPRGISNMLSKDHAQIHISTGLLLCILNWVDHKTDLNPHSSEKNSYNEK